MNILKTEGVREMFKSENHVMDEYMCRSLGLKYEHQKSKVEVAADGFAEIASKLKLNVREFEDATNRAKLDYTSFSASPSCSELNL